jgi:hypothetical protein
MIPKIHAESFSFKLSEAGLGTLHLSEYSFECLAYLSMDKSCMKAGIELFFWLCVWAILPCTHALSSEPGS